MDGLSPRPSLYKYILYLISPFRHQGSDPSTYEMIQKIQTLQKRLISKTEEVVEKELLIQEKEKLYVELKHILARQPGPEVAEQLQIYQQTLKEKTKQMKVRGVGGCRKNSGENHPGMCPRKGRNVSVTLGTYP